MSQKNYGQKKNEPTPSSSTRLSDPHHPIFPGWTPDFIPLVLEKGIELKLDQEMLEIPDGAAVAMSKSLARNEGILTG